MAQLLSVDADFYCHPPVREGGLPDYALGRTATCWRELWSWVTVRPDATLFVAREHGPLGVLLRTAVPPLDALDRIVSLDAHHDAYEGSDPSATWTRHAPCLVDVVYPAWRQGWIDVTMPPHGLRVRRFEGPWSVAGTYDAVYLCASPAYGPDGDAIVAALAATCPAQRRVWVEQ